MSKPNKKNTSKSPLKPKRDALESFVIKWGWLILIALPLLMYFRTINYTLTQLDDYIFIFDKAEFNKHFANIFKAFTIGVFNERDVYYRPLFLVSFVLEFPLGLGLNAHEKSLMVYHITNVLLHIGCVLVLHSFLRQLNIKPVSAWLLTLIFAVHPVLTMAVAWIPGRNDTMLTLFALLFLKSFLHYIQTLRTKYFVLQVLWLLLAFFTKETAVLLPLVAVGLYWALRSRPLPLAPKGGSDIQSGNLKSSSTKSPLGDLGARAAWLLLSWATIFILWYLMRLQAIDSKYFSRSIGQAISDGFSRLPAYIVYLGKIFLPVNLSVFPSLSNSTLTYGLFSLGVLVGLIFVTRNKNYKLMLLGLGWFVLFILPFFFVPKEINDQVFEHRLYLPLIGILIFLSQTLLFNGQINRLYTIVGTGVVIVIFFIISFTYLPIFKDQVKFWRNAVNASPESSYAQKLLGARLMDEMNDFDRAGKKDSAEIIHKEALAHFQEAYRLNKEEKHARFFIVRDILEPKDSLDKGITLLREEIGINPTYTEAYFEMAHIFFMKNMIDSSLKYLLITRNFQPKDEMINNNLVLDYIKLNDYKGAKNQANYMINNGLPVKDNIMAGIEAIPH